eukprot:8702612-Lingulodinium_polyedra.AAC.1
MGARTHASAKHFIHRYLNPEDLDGVIADPSRAEDTLKKADDSVRAFHIDRDVFKKVFDSYEK